MTADTAKPKVIEQITRAFEDVVRSDGVSLHETEVIRHNADYIDPWKGEEERMAARKIDIDNRWQDVPWEWIEKLYYALYFLDPKGWRYYIPAYMIYSLKTYTTSSKEAVDSTLYSLILSKDTKKRKGLEEHGLSYFKVLTVEQSRAVYQFLHFMAIYDPNGWAAREALNSYWDRFSDD